MPNAPYNPYLNPPYNSYRISSRLVLSHEVQSAESIIDLHVTFLENAEFPHTLVQTY